MRLPWGPKARARRREKDEAAGWQWQEQQRAEAFARIRRQAETGWNAPTSYLPLRLSAPLFTRAQADRANRRP